MSPATLTRPVVDRRRGCVADTGRQPSSGPAVTLADAVDTLWGSLEAHEPIACPLCGDEMRPQYSAGAGVVAGRCTSCSATLD